MTMDFRFYKADPEPGTNVQWPEQDPGTEPTFTLVALQRDADPDANTHDGFDYFGAYNFRAGPNIRTTLRGIAGVQNDKARIFHPTIRVLEGLCEFRVQSLAFRRAPQ